MRKNKGLFLTVAIVGGMALMLTLGVVGKNLFADPHAGHDHTTTTTDGHEGHDHATTTTTKLDAGKSYTLTENEDGTYSYSVKNFMGNVMHSEQSLSVKPEIVKVDDCILAISVTPNKSWPLSRKVTFCNIKSMDVITHDMALDYDQDQVAFVTRMTDKWLVFVTDFFNYNNGPTAYAELTDLAIQPNGQPYATSKFDENGDLVVTYKTETDEKTVTVKMSK